jgi:hypothetical protein
MIIIASGTVQADRYALAFPKIGGDLVCLHKAVLDLCPEENLARLNEAVLGKGVAALLLDYTNTDYDIVATPGGMDLAACLADAERETFFLARRAEYDGSNHTYPYRTRLFWASKRLGHKQEAVRGLFDVGQFNGQVFRTKTGEIAEFSAGDNGSESRRHAISEGHAYMNFDWPAILETIRKCVASVQAQTATVS